MLSSITRPHAPQTTSPRSWSFINFVEPHSGHLVSFFSISATSSFICSFSLMPLLFSNSCSSSSESVVSIFIISSTSKSEFDINSISESSGVINPTSSMGSDNIKSFNSWSVALSVSVFLSSLKLSIISSNGFGCLVFSFFGLSFGLSSVFLVFLGLPGPLFFGLSSVFLVFLGLPGPLFLGFSVFSQ